MEPVIERPALPLSLQGLAQSLTAVCQQYGQRINRLILGPHYPITDAERAAGLTRGDIDTLIPPHTVTGLANVKRYGAQGDNSTDDTDAIKTAYNVIKDTGGVIFFPPGTYLFSGLEITHNLISIYGVDRRSTQLNYTGSGTAIDVKANNGGLFANFRLITSTGSVGIKLGSETPFTGAYYKLRHVYVYDFSDKQFHFANCELCEVANCLASGGQYGFYIDASRHQDNTNTAFNYFGLCRAIGQTTEAWHIEQCQASTFEQCEALNCTGPFQVRVVGSSRKLTIRNFDIEAFGVDDPSASIGLQLSGREHYVDVSMYKLGTGIKLAFCTDSVIGKCQMSSITTPIVVDPNSSNNVILDTGDYAITFQGRDNNVIGFTERVSDDHGDADATLQIGESERTNIWNTPLTADRAVTLETDGAYNGAKFRIVRTAAATGAFSLNVGAGPLKALGAGEWCDVEFDGSAWVLTAHGTL